jgi:hypothetical protein
MDYEKVLGSTYKWVLTKGAAWFVLFFIISISIFILVPILARQGIFFDEPSIPVVNLLYFFNTVVLFVGFFALIEFVLKTNGFSVQKVTPGKLVDSVFLMVLMAWYIFVWNLHKPHRLVQILSLFVSIFALFSIAYYSNLLVELSVIIFGIIYFAFVIKNFIRFSFSYFIFYDRKLTMKHALLESWKITENRVFDLFKIYIFAGGVILVMGLVIVFIIGSITSVFIYSSFIPPVVYKISMLVGLLFASSPMLIASQSCIVEAYAQVNVKNEIKKSVESILVKRTLSSKNKVIQKNKKAKRTMNKKSVNKKTMKKNKNSLKKKTKKK